ncbi:ribonuclease H-like domain-containing protein [Phyllosticta capitalensis]
MYPIPKKRSPCSIINRRYQPCYEVEARSPGPQFCTCSYCDRFLTSSYISESGAIHCRTHVVFTDGACLNNGQANPSAGWGIATGANKSQCYVSPFDCSFGQRTNQRAELTGAYEGMIRGLRDMKKSCPHYEQLHTDNGDRMELLLVTDSEYVVKTMTKWLPKWKVNDMKTSFGQTPANLDIISHFDDRIEFLKKQDVQVGFMHVLRHRNELADKFAKRAAEVDRKLMHGVSRDNAFDTVIASSPDLAVSDFISTFKRLPSSR